MSDLLPPACAHADRFLIDLLFDEPSVDEAVRLHVAECPRCLAALADLRRARDAAATLPAEEPSAAMNANILAALDAHLAGESVARFMTQPEPEIALGAKRLLEQHITRPPGRPALRIVASAPPPSKPPQKPREETTPVRAPALDTQTTRPRRRWTSTLAMAASVALVGGGALYLSKNDNGASPLHRSEPATAPPPPAAAKPMTPSSAAAFEQAKADNAAAVEERDKDQADAKAVAEKSAAMAAPAKKAKGASQHGNSLGLMGGSGGYGKASGGPAPRAAAVDDAVGDTVLPPPAPSAQTVSRAFAPPPPPAAPAAAPAPVAAQAMEEAEAVPMRNGLEGDSKPREKKSANIPTEPWSTPLQQAHAAGRANPGAALSAWDRVLATAGLPGGLQQEALLGRVHALIALGRLNEAQAAADELTRRFPSLASARAEVQQARANYAPTVPTASGAAATVKAPPAAKEAAPQPADH